MKAWWGDLDRILRGEATRMIDLRKGTIEISVGGVTIALWILATTYGACMGCFAIFKAGGPAFWQMLASMVKVPALFLLTLAVTLPSLYVFNALMGSALSLRSVVRLLASSLAIIITVLASLGPIVAFFSVSTTSYAFMVLLNVAVFGVSGLLGLAFLMQTLQRLSAARALPPPLEPVEHVGESKEGPLEQRQGRSGEGALDALDDQPRSRHANMVFRCWVVLFGLVGAQMGWVLRPFIGNPKSPFQWLRERDSNFFEAVWSAFASFFS